MTEGRGMTHRTGTQDSQAAGGAEGGPVRPGSGPFAALGRMVTRHPWRVIAVWLIAAVAVIATAPALPTTTNEASFLPSSYESIKAQNLQDQAFPEAGKVDAAAAIIVFARSDGGRADSRRPGEGRLGREHAERVSTSRTS